MTAQTGAQGTARSGRRPVPVILTRPAGRNERLASALRAAGRVVQVSPALVIEPLPFDGPLPQAHSLFVFVSRQAVDAYFSAVRAAWPDDAWAGAVGAVTARALARYVPPGRILAPALPATPDSESLLAVIDQQGFVPHAVHILRSTRGRDWLADQMRRRGWAVQCHAIYRRTAAPWPPALCQAFSASTGAVVLVTSLEALAAIDDSLARSGLDWPDTLRVVTLHARIARRLQCLYADRPAGALSLRLSAPDDQALFQAIMAMSLPCNQKESSGP